MILLRIYETQILKEWNSLFDRFSLHWFVSAQALSKRDSFVVFEEPLDDLMRLCCKEDFRIDRWVEHKF